MKRRSRTGWLLPREFAILRAEVRGMRLWCLGLIVLAACTSTTNAADDASSYVGCNGDPRVNLPGSASSGTDSASLEATGLSGSNVSLRVAFDAPSVPLAGENTWTVTVLNPGGPAVAAISADAFMPDHGHPSSVTPVATLLPDGTWRIEHLNFSMSGVWRVTFKLTRVGVDDPATAVAYVCVTG
jgi:hypothetical protein